MEFVTLLNTRNADRLFCNENAYIIGISINGKLSYDVLILFGFNSSV